jgi:putative Mn2+ efflux pump MntP
MCYSIKRNCVIQEEKLNILQVILIGIGLSMDAFAISLCHGLCKKHVSLNDILQPAIIFGGFQALMPIIGFFIGSIFNEKISQYGNIIAFIILVYLGINMIKEARSEECEECSCKIDKKENNLKNLLFMGVATSIDALAVGFTFSLTEVTNIYFQGSVIGIVTFIIAGCGVIMGHKFGTLLESKAQYLGGAILILIGIKTLIGNFV